MSTSRPISTSRAPIAPRSSNSLLITGEGITPRDLGMMGETVRARLNRLTPHERGALVGYLKARAGRPQ